MFSLCNTEECSPNTNCWRFLVLCKRDHNISLHLFIFLWSRIETTQCETQPMLLGDEKSIWTFNEMHGVRVFVSLSLFLCFSPTKITATATQWKKFFAPQMKTFSTLEGDLFPWALWFLDEFKGIFPFPNSFGHPAWHTISTYNNSDKITRMENIYMGPCKL